MTSDLGKWVHTGGVAKYFLKGPGFSDKDHLEPAQIYSNERHQAILLVELELWGEDNKKLDEFPTADAVLRSVRLVNFNDDDGVTDFGTGESQGWTVDEELSCYANPLMATLNDPGINFSAKEYKNTVDETSSIAYLYYYISRSSLNADNGSSCEIGVIITPMDATQIPIKNGTTYTNTKKGKLSSIGLNSIPELVFTENDITWNGAHIMHDGERDVFVAGVPEKGNFWREIAYSAALKDNSEYPSDLRYFSRIYRCGLEKDTPYKTPATGETLNYTFGVRRNGLYAFTGYFWPFNVYKEDDISKIEAKPIGIQTNLLDENQTTYQMNSDGLGKTRPTIDYDSSKIFFSILCSFGWTSNDVYDFRPYKISLYDQYGNMGIFNVDPQLIPNKYIPPDTENGFDQLKFLSNVSSYQLPSAPSENTLHVNFQIIAKTTDNGGDLYLEVEEVNGLCDPIVKRAGKDQQPAVSNLNAFRFYRIDTDPSEDSLAENCTLAYNIASYQYPDVTLSERDGKMATVPIHPQVDAGWTPIPIWGNNAFALWRASADAYMAVSISDNSNKLVITTDTDEMSILEWTTAVISNEAYDSASDIGNGYDTSIYSTPNQKSGRRSWAGISAMALSFDGSTTKAAIYANGLNQAKIFVTMTPTDGNGHGLNADNAPTAAYILNSVYIIDYFDKSEVERNSKKKGWSFSSDSNVFGKHTSPLGAISLGSALGSSEDFYYSYDAANNVQLNCSLYVTCDAGVADIQRTLGIKFEITDEKWGDPIVFTCSSGPTGSADVSNFSGCVVVTTKQPIQYTTNSLSITADNQSAAGQTDDWPSNDSGIETASNFWRIWNYKVNINQNLGGQSIYKCVTSNLQKLVTLDDFGNISVDPFEKDFDGLYGFVAYCWPTNMVDVNFKPIDGSDLTNFDVSFADGASQSIVTSIDGDDNSIYLTIYGQFGGILEHRDTQKCIDFTIYDSFGNSGKFHLNTGSIPTTYNKKDFSSAKLIADNPSKFGDSEDFDLEPAYLIHNFDDYININRYLTIGSYNSGVTYDIYAEDNMGINSLYTFDEVGDKVNNSIKEYYMKSVAYDTFYVGHGYTDWLLFAGTMGTARFSFHYLPVWSKRGFLMGAGLSEDFGRAVVCLIGSEQSDQDYGKRKAYLYGVTEDPSFVWQLHYSKKPRSET
ncbi:hypothetical protein G3A39_37725 [Paraburkholderia aspalathi]|nr:hypothetical protein [Paraburkholderia aspalathi]